MKAEQNAVELRNVKETEKNLETQNALAEETATLQAIQAEHYKYLAENSDAIKHQIDLSKSSNVWSRLTPIDARNLQLMATVQKDNPFLDEKMRDSYAFKTHEIALKAQETWPEYPIYDETASIGKNVIFRDLADLEHTLVINTESESPLGSVYKTTTELVKHAMQGTEPEQSGAETVTEVKSTQQPDYSQEMTMPPDISEQTTGRSR
jgi:hypothetical protein